MILFAVDDEIFILFPRNLLFHFDSITEEEYSITAPQFVDVVVALSIPNKVTDEPNYL